MTDTRYCAHEDCPAAGEPIPQATATRSADAGTATAAAWNCWTSNRTSPGWADGC